jgi:hypothetical protein
MIHIGGNDQGKCSGLVLEAKLSFPSVKGEIGNQQGNMGCVVGVCIDPRMLLCEA